MALAVFDIDGTLVAGPSTEKRLFLFLLGNGLLKPAQILGFLRFGLTHAAEYGRHVWKKDKAYLAGLPTAELEGLVGAWVRDSAPEWWYPPSLARLRQHQASGDPVILLSGTPQFLADALARELGVERAIGTRCASAAGRFLAGPPLLHPFGTRKATLLKELCAGHGVPAEAVFAYGDSIHDREVLALAGHPVAVRPDRGLRAAAAAAGWEILGSR